MAAKLRENADDLIENSEINVTPFIDVMLVLLIIFMVAAPLSTVDVAVDLPGAAAKPAQRPDEPLYLTVQADGALSLGETPVTRDALAEEVGRVTEGDHDTRIFLRADKAIDYGTFMEVMNLLRQAGYLKIALVGLEQMQPVDRAVSEGGATGADTAEVDRDE